MEQPLLAVESLRAEFSSGPTRVAAVRSASFTIEKGETVALVGESGSGKSTLALALLNLLPRPAGRIAGGSVKLAGRELVGLSEREMRGIRGGEVAMIFQDPFASLNPTMTLGRQIVEALEVHTGMKRAQAKARAVELLEAVGIPEARARFRQYPHQVSGGQRQRVMIAIAFACSPALILADEPTTALDVTMQAQVLKLLADLKRRNGSGVLFVTHDLAIVAENCERVLVMYAGTIVESAPVRKLFETPLHPYTRGLLAALPDAGADRQAPIASIPGLPPSPAQLPPGCPFAPRCPDRIDAVCTAHPPGVTTLGDDQSVRCYLYGAAREREAI